MKKNKFKIFGVAILSLIIFLCFFLGYSKFTKKNKHDIMNSCSIYIIEFSRKVYRLDSIEEIITESLIINFPEGKYYIERNDSPLFSGQISDTFRSELKTKLGKINNTDWDKIYNAGTNDVAELELYLHCSDNFGSHMVKSFGQHGNNPPEIKEVYSYLLRFLYGKLQDMD